MPERFTIADLHLGHKSIVQFASRVDEGALRPEWGRPCPNKDMPADEVAERVEAMNEAMIERWNAVVGPKDKVYVLGDITTGRQPLELVSRLNGKIDLYLGNHDTYLKDYPGLFRNVGAYKEIDDFVLCHIPLHPDAVRERWKGNVHGHLHEQRVMKTVYAGITPRLGSVSPVTKEVIDPLYFSVSAEQINFTPIPWEEVKRRFEDQQERRAA